jgi:hypothetical protein
MRTLMPLTGTLVQMSGSNRRPTTRFRSTLRGVTATDVWMFYEALAERSREDLTPLQRGVAAICDLRQEVNSGGFDGYFSYWGGDTAREALDVLPASLGEDWAALLREAMDLLGPTYPTEQSERETVLDDLDLSDAFGALDERFYALEASMNADARLSALLGHQA